MSFHLVINGYFVGFTPSLWRLSSSFTFSFDEFLSGCLIYELLMWIQIPFRLLETFYCHYSRKTHKNLSAAAFLRFDWCLFNAAWTLEGFMAWSREEINQIFIYSMKCLLGDRLIEFKRHSFQNSLEIQL